LLLLRLLRVGSLTLEAGRRMLKKYKGLYAECEKTGEWPGHEGISDIEMSDFDLRKCGLTNQEINSKGN